MTRSTKLPIFRMFFSIQLLLLLGLSLSVSAASQPNIILILTDDQGYGDLGRHGHPILRTPNLDTFHDESVRLDNFYVSPSCSPTRAALLTGMHEFQNAVTHTLEPREHLYVGATILPQLLKPAGYKNAFIGKWHLSYKPGYAPNERGFDWCSTNPQGPREHFDPVMVRNGVKAKRKGFREDVYFDEAMTFIKECQGQPFFCYLATYSPHTPLDAPKDLIDHYRGKVTEKQATYLAMVENIDQNVGRLTDFLKAEGLEKDTIVIFMNDNGETEGLDVYNANMRGCKATVWEGGSRAMSFWRWPGIWTPHTVNNLTAHLDVVPTLCALAGAEIPESLQGELEGFSLLPLLEAQQDTAWEHDNRYLYHNVGRWPSGTAASHQYAMCGVRQGDFLLLRSLPCKDDECAKFQSQCSTMRAVQNGLTSTTYTQGNAQYHWGVNPSDQWLLINVKKDPGCQTDLSDKYPEKVAEMIKSYDGWWERMFPVMLERGGDLGDPNESQNAGRISAKVQAQKRAERLQVFVKALSANHDGLDGNHDGRVSEEEYIKAFEQTFVDMDADQNGTLTASEFPFPSFKSADADGDGLMSLEEHRAFRAAEFNRADANKDGRLSPDEM